MSQRRKQKNVWNLVGFRLAPLASRKAKLKIHLNIWNILENVLKPRQSVLGATRQRIKYIRRLTRWAWRRVTRCLLQIILLLEFRSEIPTVPSHIRIQYVLPIWLDTFGVWWHFCQEGKAEVIANEEGGEMFYFILWNLSLEAKAWRSRSTNTFHFIIRQGRRISWHAGQISAGSKRGKYHSILQGLHR